MTDLSELRAELSVAEAAYNDVPEEATVKVRNAAKAKLAAATKALRDAHIEAQAREAAKVKIETRPVKVAVEQRPKSESPEEAPEVVPAVAPRRRQTFQEFIQAGSTQNVKGTHELTPEQHAARRNPKHT